MVLGFFLGQELDFKVEMCWSRLRCACQGHGLHAMVLPKVNDIGLNLIVKMYLA